MVMRVPTLWLIEWGSPGKWLSAAWTKHCQVNLVARSTQVLKCWLMRLDGAAVPWPQRSDLTLNYLTTLIQAT